MANIDIFNGDADGICALVQLRNAQPKSSRLVTGVKRDIALVAQVEYQADDEVTVLDISFDKNREGVESALESGARVLYFDHHFAGDVPESKNLEICINTTSDVCTSVLVNEHLGGAFRAWAVVGAFGDNLNKTAEGVAKPLNLSDGELEQLKALGTYINYNGYGSKLEDLHFEPAALYSKLVEFANPLDFIAEDKTTFDQLERGYYLDMSAARAITPKIEMDSVAVFVFPDEAWARRVSGVYSNDLVNEHPNRAHAVLTERSDGSYLVSLRAPLNNKTGADEICRQFPTGGGRTAAAGINELPADLLESFIDVFSNFYRL